jgi:cation diffusion facilitator CzcD-associated flavoprotein CzcO
VARSSIIIIGTGFAGIGLAIALKKAGYVDIRLLEKRDSVGGVWRDNTYPGAACDVPSHLYSYSFERDYEWPNKFSGQADIRAYIEYCANKYDVMRHVRFNTEVVSARFDEASSEWIVQCADGTALQARFLVSASGQLNRPAWPDITGMQDFAGNCFHSAAWDHGVDMVGRRIAVIGTGASAIQFIPHLARSASQLVVLQRSPPYIIPRYDRAYSATERKLLERFPWLRGASRLRTYLLYEIRVLGFTWLQPAMILFRGLWWWHMCRTIKDPQLRAKLTPQYRMGCKRILMSDDYYPALAQSNVVLDTQAIERFESKGVRMRDGGLHEVDAIVLATGFHATDFLAPMQISGRNDRALDEAWKDGAYAHLGISMPDFPNLFMLYGPNTNLGHNSIVYMIESQIRHIVDAIAYCDRNGIRSVEPASENCRRYNDAIQQRLKNTVWNAGCSNWYVNEHGRQTNNWPGFTFEYRYRVRRFRPHEYRLAT